jgi:hypothetical protein
MLRPFGVFARFLFRIYRKGLRANIDDLIWVGDQWLRKLRMNLLSAEQKENIGIELMDNDCFNSSKECFITITFGSRQFGNRDNRLKDFLQSFLAMTVEPSRVEILIKIDDDDDLRFFQVVKRSYGGRINLRFLVSGRGRGYADMHHFHDNLLRLRSPSTRLLYILTEDAVFIRSGWDIELMAILNSRQHDFFIGTPASFEETIMIMGPDPVKPVPIYWVRGDDFPIFGLELLDCTKGVALEYPGWTCLGNLFNVDWFSGDILRRLWQINNMNLHVQVPQFAERKGIFSWNENPQRNHLRTKTLQSFFLEENQKIRDKMATAIFENVKKRS